MAACRELDAWNSVCEELNELKDENINLKQQVKELQRLLRASLKREQALEAKLPRLDKEPMYQPKQSATLAAFAQQKGEP